MRAVAEQLPAGGDHALMAAVARGDADARRTLARRVAPRVARVCRAIFRARPDADDAAQGALVEILRSASGFAGTGSLEGWADRIAVRHALREAARERRRIAVVDDDADLERIVPALDEDAIDATAAGRLADYLDRIAPQQRELLVLHHVLDYSVREIAEDQGAAIGTIKDRLLVARKQVRRLLLRDLALAGTKARRHA